MQVQRSRVLPHLDLLQIGRPNKFKIIHMDIPIVRWTDPENGEIHEDKVFCSDILDAKDQHK